MNHSAGSIVRHGDVSTHTPRQDGVLSTGDNVDQDEMEPMPEQQQNIDGFRSSNGAVLPAINTQNMTHEEISNDILPSKRPKLKHRYKVKESVRDKNSPKNQHGRKDSVALHQSIV